MIEQIQFVRLFGVAKVDNLLQEMLLGSKLNCYDLYFFIRWNPRHSNEMLPTYKRVDHNRWQLDSKLVKRHSEETNCGGILTGFSEQMVKSTLKPAGKVLKASSSSS